MVVRWMALATVVWVVLGRGVWCEDGGGQWWLVWLVVGYGCVVVAVWWRLAGGYGGGHRKRWSEAGNSGVGVVLEQGIKTLRRPSCCSGADWSSGAAACRVVPANAAMLFC